MPSALTGVPDSTSPLTAGLLRSSVAVGVTVTNGAGTSQQGSDITAVASPRSNYKFTMRYSTADPIAAVGTAFYPSFSASELRLGLAGSSGTRTFAGSVNYPAISAANCQSITHVCILAEPDTLNGASFLVATIQSTCTPVEVNCYPGKRNESQQIRILECYFVNKIIAFILRSKSGTFV